MFAFIFLSVVFSRLLAGADGVVELEIKPLGVPRHVKAEGTSMVFTCQQSMKTRDEDVVLKFEWRDVNSNKISDKTGWRYVENVDNGLKLYITNITMSDAGIYKCNATADDGTSDEKSTELVYFQEIAFNNVQKEQHPRIHEDATINCSVSGSPKPTVSWKYEGTRVSLKDPRYKQSAQNGLIISNITQKDNGQYTCRAEVDDDGRYDERIIKVEVHIPPKLTFVPDHTKRGTQGDDISISCAAEGLPSPTYKFFKGNADDKAVVSSTDSIRVDEIKGVLTFTPVNKTDEANYTCRAINDAGKDDARIFIEVRVKPLIFEFADVTQSEKLPVVLVCQSHGDPAPNMSFINVSSGEVYSLGNEVGNKRWSVSGGTPGRLELIINNLQLSDAGRYRCKVENEVGQHQQDASITVNYKPVFDSSMVLAVYSWVGAKNNLTCLSHGRPTPEISWKRFDSVIDENNSTYTIYTQSTADSTRSTLEITVTEMEASWIFREDLYSCQSTNPVGTSSMDIQLKRATSPDKPKSVEITETLADSISLTVTEPEETGGIPIIGYTVEYSVSKTKASSSERTPSVEDHHSHSNLMTPTVTSTAKKNDDDDDDDDDDRRELTTTASVQSFNFDGNHARIRDLKADTSYDVRVKARNAVGSGPEVMVVVTTKKLSVPGVIHIKTRPTVLVESSFVITWEMPNTGGLPVQEYEITYTTAKVTGDGSAVTGDHDWSTSTPVKIKGSMLSYKLSSLTPQTSYAVRIRARNDIGWSPYTPVFSFRTVEWDVGADDSLLTADADTESVRWNQSSLSLGPVIAIAVVVVLLVAIVTDVVRYATNRGGVTSFICVRACSMPPRDDVKQRANKSEKGEQREEDSIDLNNALIGNEINLVDESPEHSTANETRRPDIIEERLTSRKPTEV